VNLEEKLRLVDRAPELLAHLTQYAGERAFAGLGLAAGQVEDVGRRPLADQQQAPADNDGRGDHAQLAHADHRGSHFGRHLGGLRWRHARRRS
jgi:hypothetical protein